MIFKMPASVTEQISRRAVQIIQSTAPKRTGRAANGIQPDFDTGVVGVDVPDNVAYLLDLDRGVKARAQLSIGGKVIPFRDADGSMSFRRVKSSSIGQIPIITRAPDDGRLTDGKPLWVKAAKPGLNFIDNAIERSIKEWERGLKEDDIIKILRQTPMRDAIEKIFDQG